MNKLHCAWLLFAVCSCVRADGLFAGGHTKFRLNAVDYPDESLLAVFGDNPGYDQGGDLRLKFAVANSHWSAVADYQFIAQRGDSLEVSSALLDVPLLPDRVQNDDHRLFDLTDTISDGKDHVAVQRLDRLYVERRQDQWVARAGRQALSWGNGLFYTPMDFINPFDPAAIDREYKSGDDMAYAQYLRCNGDDWQVAYVLRRDANENLDSDVNTFAIKYHGFAGSNEYDLLLAQHYGDTVIGAGGSVPWGGALLRGDLTATDSEDGTIWSAVGSWSWSWLGMGKNMTAAVEYFYSGFGQDHEQYAPPQLANNPELVSRILRGELYTLGKQYLAASLLVEVTPLLQVTPNLFINLDDHSVLSQVVGQYSVAENWELLLALNVPLGSSGSEYGGFASGVADYELSYGRSAFAQLAWYF